MWAWKQFDIGELHCKQHNATRSKSNRSNSIQQPPLSHLYSMIVFFVNFEDHLAIYVC